MLKQYWLHQDQQTRLRLSLAIGIIFALGLWLFAWEPLQKQNQLYLNTLEKKKQTLSWMQQASNRLKSFSGGLAVSSDDANLQQKLNRLAQNHKLQVKRVNTFSDGRVLLIYSINYGNRVSCLTIFPSSALIIAALWMRNSLSNRDNEENKHFFNLFNHFFWFSFIYPSSR